MEESVSKALSETIFEIFLESVDVSKDISLIERFGANEFDLLEIVVAMEDRFGIDIDDDDLHLFGNTVTAVQTVERYVGQIRDMLQQV